MRRLTAAVYFLASAICLAASVVAPGERGAILGLPILLFLGFGVYNLSRGRDDDHKTS